MEASETIIDLLKKLNAWANPKPASISIQQGRDLDGPFEYYEYRENSMYGFTSPDLMDFTRDVMFEIANNSKK